MGGGARLKSSLALIPNSLELPRTHKNSLRTHWEFTETSLELTGTRWNWQELNRTHKNSLRTHGHSLRPRLNSLDFNRTHKNSLRIHENSLRPRLKSLDFHRSLENSLQTHGNSLRPLLNSPELIRTLRIHQSVLKITGNSLELYRHKNKKLWELPTNPKTQQIKDTTSREKR